MNRAWSVARAQLSQDVRSPLRVVVVLLLAGFGFFVISPWNFMPGDFAKAGEWWLAGQAFWSAGQYGALVVFLLCVRSVAADRDAGCIEQQAATPLHAGEYLAGKMLAASILAVAPGIVLLAVAPLYRFAMVGHANPWPYAAAFLSVYTPPVVLAAILAVALGAVLSDVRIGIVGYTAYWLMSAFPFLIPEAVGRVGITGTTVYSALFEFGDAGALAQVPADLRPLVEDSLAQASAAVPFNVALYVVLAAGLVLVATGWLATRWRGAADGLW